MKVGEVPNDGWILGSAVIVIRILWERACQKKVYRMLHLPEIRGRQ